jgi:hypothetical protein
MLHNEDAYEHSPDEFSKIIIIGDVHGDIKRFLNILQHADVINKDLEWISEKTLVIQLGDVVDSLNRQTSENWEVLPDTELLYLINSLKNIAKTKQSKLISLIGNHELMNIIGNFSYVSPQSKANTENRQKLFQPAGMLSDILSNMPLVQKVGPLFFSHSFIRKHHLDILEASNKPVSYINVLWHQFMSTGRIAIEDKEIFDKIILDPSEGILWTRNMNNDTETQYVKEKLGIQYAFVGHTAVERIQLVNNFVWLVDTGISRAFGTQSYQYIYIQDYSISVKTISEG